MDERREPSRWAALVPLQEAGGHGDGWTTGATAARLRVSGMRRGAGPGTARALGVRGEVEDVGVGVGAGAGVGVASGEGRSTLYAGRVIGWPAWAGCLTCPR